MKKRAIIYFAISIVSAFYSNTFAQVRLSGAECIVPGTEYQYDLFSSLDKDLETELCVEGGYILPDKNSCYRGKDITSIRVVWNDNILKGKISITTSSGSLSFHVKATRILQGGKIDSLSELKVTQSFAIPQDINCSPARGGSCTPSYKYQWEQSDDNVRWTEVKGGVFQHLTFIEKIEHTVFFRRRTFEETSNTTSYSDVAIIVVAN